MRRSWVVAAATIGVSGGLVLAWTADRFGEVRAVVIVGTAFVGGLLFGTLLYLAWERLR